MRMSIYSIELVSRATEMAITTLDNNLKWTKDSVIGELSNMQDPAADKCLEQMESFSTKVRDAVEDLKHIQQILAEHKRFYELMNE